MRLPLPLLSHCSSAPLSYGSTTAASLLPRRRAAPLLPRLLPHRVAPLRPRRSAAAFLYPPTALLLPRRSSTLPRCSAPRRSASLCYMLPALHRAASLLPRCFAAAAPLRLLPLHSASSSRMRLNQSLLGLEHSKTCSASCTVGACLLQHRCFLCIAPFCTAQSAWTLTSWGSSRSQERIAIMIRMIVCVVTVTVVVSIVIHTLLVPNEHPLRKATQARFPSPLSNCLVCRCNSY